MKRDEVVNSLNMTKSHTYRKMKKVPIHAQKKIKSSRVEPKKMTQTVSSHFFRRKRAKSKDSQNSKNEKKNNSQVFGMTEPDMFQRRLDYFKRRVEKIENGGKTPKVIFF